MDGVPFLKISFLRYAERIYSTKLGQSTTCLNSLNQTCMECDVKRRIVKCHILSRAACSPMIDLTSHRLYCHIFKEQLKYSKWMKFTSIE